MNKILKTTLITVILTTSGFTASIAELKKGGEIQPGASITLNSQTIALNANTQLDVYGTITGTIDSIIDCTDNGGIKGNNAKVVIYSGGYAKDSNNDESVQIKTTCLPALSDGEKIDVYRFYNEGLGKIENVTVNPEASKIEKNTNNLITIASNLENPEKAVFYIANKNAEPVNCIGGTLNQITISSALGNAYKRLKTGEEKSPIEGFKSAGLIMTNKLQFGGDNSGFKRETITIGTNEMPAEVKYNTTNSVFPVKTTVEIGSTLTFPGKEEGEVTLKKDLIVKSSDNKHGTLIIPGKLTIPAGVKLTIGNKKQ